MWEHPSWMWEHRGPEEQPGPRVPKVCVRYPQRLTFGPGLLQLHVALCRQELLVHLLGPGRGITKAGCKKRCE